MGLCVSMALDVDRCLISINPVDGNRAPESHTLVLLTWWYHFWYGSPGTKGEVSHGSIAKCTPLLGRSNECCLSVSERMHFYECPFIIVIGANYVVRLRRHCDGFVIVYVCVCVWHVCMCVCVVVYVCGWVSGWCVAKPKMKSIYRCHYLFTPTT